MPSKGRILVQVIISFLSDCRNPSESRESYKVHQTVIFKISIKLHWLKILREFENVGALDSSIKKEYKFYYRIAALLLKMIQIKI